MPSTTPVTIATRGSALALAQANLILAQCRAAYPRLAFELKIIKTTGDKLQKASMANPAASLPKGLFTKELEVALLAHEADLAVHSLKDLPTELPDGLFLAGVLPRADARDVLIHRTADSGVGRGYPSPFQLADLASDALVATSSTRRKEQLLAVRPSLRVVEIRGNVGTRLQKIATQPELDATLLAAAGLLRLGFLVGADGTLNGPTPDSVPPGLRAVWLDAGTMIPAVGQAAIGLETRMGDIRSAQVIAALNHAETMQAVLAERAFLRAMGGGCQSPVAAYATLADGQLTLRGVSFRHGPAQRGEVRGAATAAAAIGQQLAEQLR